MVAGACETAQPRGQLQRCQFCKTLVLTTSSQLQAFRGLCPESSISERITTQIDSSMQAEGQRVIFIKLLRSRPCAAAEPGNSPQSSGDRNADSGGGSGHRRSTLDGCNSGSPSNIASGKSFRQVLAERNKQAQRRFRQRQKVNIIPTSF